MGDVIEILTTATNTVEVEAQGPQGIPGVGVPTGGSTGQVLRKASAADYATEWAAAGSGSGSVTSVALASSDFTISGSPITDAGTITANLGNTGVTAGTYTKVTVDAKGRVTTGETATATDVGAPPTSRAISAGTGLTGGGDLSANRTLSVSFGSSAGTACEGNDARLSDSRTPTAHAASHAAGQADELFDQSLNQADDVTFASVSLNAEGIKFEGNARINLEERSLYGAWGLTEGFYVGTGNYGGSLTVGKNATTVAVFSAANLTDGSTRNIDIPDASGTLMLVGDAPASHTHGNITNGGLVGTTSGLPLKTGTGGIVEAGAFGTSAGTFAAGDHTHTQLHDRSHAITSTSDHTAGNHKVFYSDGSGQVQELALGSSGTVLTSNGATSAPSFAAASGGVGGGSGSVDNAIIRADGTGGSTVQSSDINIEDATTSTANNVTISNQHSGQTNSSLVLSPKGTGSLSASKPNGAASGGNARGANATDWQTLRTAATQVASGTGSVIIGGDRNTSSSTCTIAGGENCTASGTYSIALGRTNAATTGAANAVVGGQNGTATGSEAFIGGGGANSASASYTAILSGNYGLADRSGMLSQANGRFAATGDAQWIHMVLRAKTTTNSAVELLINNDRTTNGRLTCPSGKIISGIINIHGVKSDGTASAHYVRQFQVKNVGGTSSYPYAAALIGTDYASSTSITFNDPDTNGDALSVSVTGIASETWRWTAHISAVETAYGT